jgi:hypothetical protein
MLALNRGMQRVPFAFATMGFLTLVAAMVPVRESFAFAIAGFIVMAGVIETLQHNA